MIFKKVESSIRILLTYTSKLVTHDSSHVSLTSINTDLDGLRIRLFEVAHPAIKVKSSLITAIVAAVSESLKDFNNRTSSAYMYRQETVGSCDRSATKILKRIGPSTDP